ncbi:MAG: FlgD immunoglobulin-like domain containing protein, partial [Candidatus Hodarchaeota archaeon]
WTKIKKDISEYDYLTLAVKAKSSKLNPGNFKLELTSATQTHKATVSNITTSFEEKPLYLNQFDPPNPNQIQELTFVFEKNVQERLIGAIFVDEIELRKTGSKESEKSKPDKPINNLLNGVKQDEYNCTFFENNFKLESILTGDISLLESVRLEYEKQNNWYVIERIYATNNSSLSWNVQKTDLPQEGIVSIRIIAQNYNSIDSDGFYLKVTSDSKYVSVSQIDLTHIKTMKLFQNYPNPFNSETKINFQLNKRSWINLEIYDSLGREIRTLLNSWKTAGYYNISWDGRDNSGEKVASGIYLYKLTTDNYSGIKKMILLQ